MYAFWAQALDNVSSDHCDGRDRSGNKIEIEPERVQQLFYEVGTKGRERFSQKGVRLVQLNRKMMLEVPTLSIDRIGRGAPITIYHDFEGTGDEGTGAQCFILLENFAGSIGRELCEDCRQLVLDAYSSLKKKRGDWLILVIGCVFLIGILAAIGLWVIHPGPSKLNGQ